MKFKHFVGIDVAKDKLDVEYPDACGAARYQVFTNDLSGISKMLVEFEAQGIAPDTSLICLEHTGHYIDKLTRILHAEGYFVWVVSPLFLHNFSPGLLRGINDLAAAAKLREYARYFQDHAKRFIPDSPFESNLKNLFRLRRQLVKLRATMRNMRSSNQDLAEPDQYTDHLYSEQIKRFTEEIKIVDQMLATHMLKHPAYRRMYLILISIPCIGEVCAKQMLIMTRGFSKFTSHRAFAAHISTAPFSKSSGKRNRRPRVHQAGHKHLKANLYMAVLRHIQPGGFFEEKYRFLTEIREKHHNSVINAFINQILKIVFDLIRLNQEFDHEKYSQGKMKTAENLILS